MVKTLIKFSVNIKLRKLINFCCGKFLTSKGPSKVLRLERIFKASVMFSSASLTVRGGGATVRLASHSYSPGRSI